MTGFYRFNDLIAQGDFGIGTSGALGEMIALDAIAKIPDCKMSAHRIVTLA